MHPRKWLKQFFPKREEITNHKHLSWLGETLHDPNLWHLSRRSVSVGVAVGLLAAFIPLPLQMVTAAIFAILTRSNLFIAIATTWITNPVTFIPLNFFIYKVGQFITNDTTPYNADFMVDWSHKNWSEINAEFWRWFGAMGKPFLVGVPVVALTASLLGYILVNILWQVALYFHPVVKRKKKKK